MKKRNNDFLKQIEPEYFWFFFYFLTFSFFLAILTVLVVLVQLVWLENSKGGKDMIWIDYKDSRPIFEQIVEKYEKLILHGAIEPNTKMPSIRKLAMELSLNPNTVQKAYAELERRGYTYTVKGKGVFVNYDPKQKAEKQNKF